MPNFRLGAIDTGSKRDSFALVGADIINRKDISIFGAKEWKGEKYTIVEEQVKTIHDTIVSKRFDHILVETNNAGWHVVEALQKLKLPVIPVTTVGKVSKQKLNDINTCSKPNAVEYTQKIMQDTAEGRTDRTNLLFPKDPTSGIITLQNQLVKFTKKISKAGNTQYSAEGSAHDDLVMCLVILCDFARKRYLNTQYTPRIIQTKQFRNEQDLLGSGIPEGAQLLGSTVIYPR